MPPVMISDVIKRFWIPRWRTAHFTFLSCGWLPCSWLANVHVTWTIIYC